MNIFQKINAIFERNNKKMMINASVTAKKNLAIAGAKMVVAVQEVAIVEKIAIVMRESVAMKNATVKMCTFVVNMAKNI